MRWYAQGDIIMTWGIVTLSSIIEAEDKLLNYYIMTIIPTDKSVIVLARTDHQGKI